jgi:phosphatidylserine/phosphatidylglycerophosphate/cardiolipin synthase-like enzyme
MTEKPGNKVLLKKTHPSERRCSACTAMLNLWWQTARAVGLFTSDGTTDRVRLAELVIVLDILAAIPHDQVETADIKPLVFTVPHAAERFVTPRHRLDLLVSDVIARAQSSLHIGGPFWNEDGWVMLRPVLLPALKQRRVTVTFYLHPHESGRLEVVHEMLAEARGYGDVRTLWWAGGVPSLMHAKFAVGDRSNGYFGTANLTSLGLAEHLEVGVALVSKQAVSLLTLLDSLEHAGLFTAEPLSNPSRRAGSFPGSVNRAWQVRAVHAHARGGFS